MKPEDKTRTRLRIGESLSLLVKPEEEGERNVDAEYFFAVAERWLKALQAFANDAGQQVTWEIVGLQKSSAFVQVRPVEPETRTPVPALVRSWDAGVREIERTGRPAGGFKAGSLKALEELVWSVSPDTAVSLGNGTCPICSVESIELVVLDARLSVSRSEEHTSELQSPCNLVCR